MREFPHRFDEAFTLGLRPSAHNRPNTDRLVQCKNMRPYPTGSRLAVIPILIQGAVEAQLDWPYAQMFETSYGIVSCGKRTIKLYHETDAELYSIGSLTTGHPWSMADFEDYMLFMNGKQIVVKSGDDFGAALSVYAGSSIPVGGCCTNFNGQLIVGNLPNWYGQGANGVAWSRIGNISCIPDETNEAGFKQLPTSGEVWQVKKLGKHVMVYSEHGVTAMVPVEHPAPTYGFREIFSQGVYARQAICGSDTVHYFVDASGDLWRITDNHAITRLGYREFIQPLAKTSELVLSYHPRRDEVYISGEDSHYVYTGGGFGGPIQFPIAAAIYYKPTGYDNGGLVVSTWHPSNISFDEIVMTTDKTNFNRPGLKSAQWMEVLGDVTGTIEVAVDSKQSHRVNFDRSAYIPLNVWATGYKNVTAKDFRFSIRVLQPTQHQCFIDGLNVTWKHVDGRFLRGPAAGGVQGAEGS